MYDEDPEIAAALDRLKSELGATPKGTVIPWETIESTMRRARVDRGGWHIIRRFRAWMLRKQRIVTFASVGDGLRFLTDKDAAIESPDRRQKRAKRQLNRCVKEIDAVDRAKLSDWERRVLIAQERNVRDERRNIGRSSRTLATLLRARDTNPRVLPAVPPPVSVKFTATKKTETGPPRWTKPR